MEVVVHVTSYYACARLAEALPSHLQGISVAYCTEMYCTNPTVSNIPAECGSILYDTVKPPFTHVLLPIPY